AAELALGHQVLDVRVRQALADLHLALIATEHARIADQVGVGHLHDHFAARVRLARPVRLAHAALAQHVEDLVFAVDQLAGFVSPRLPRRPGRASTLAARGRSTRRRGDRSSRQRAGDAWPAATAHLAPPDPLQDAGHPAIAARAAVSIGGYRDYFNHLH